MVTTTVADVFTSTLMNERAIERFIKEIVESLAVGPGSLRDDPGWLRPSLTALRDVGVDPDYHFTLANERTFLA